LLIRSEGEVRVARLGGGWVSREKGYVKKPLPL